MGHQTVPRRSSTVSRVGHGVARLPAGEGLFEAIEHGVVVEITGDADDHVSGMEHLVVERLHVIHGDVLERLAGRRGAFEVILAEHQHVPLARQDALGVVVALLHRLDHFLAEQIDLLHFKSRIADHVHEEVE